MRVFLDTNVFVYGLKDSASNSRIILGLAESGKIRVVTSELVLKEVAIVFRRLSGSKAAYIAVRYVQGLCDVVPRRKIVSWASRLRGSIKEKDLENLATTKSQNIRLLVSHDRDYKGLSEYRTPKQFVKMLGLSESFTEY